MKLKKKNWGGGGWVGRGVGVDANEELVFSEKIKKKIGDGGGGRGGKGGERVRVDVNEELKFL